MDRANPNPNPRFRSLSHYTSFLRLSQLPGARISGQRERRVEEYRQPAPTQARGQLNYRNDFSEFLDFDRFVGDFDDDFDDLFHPQNHDLGGFNEEQYEGRLGSLEDRFGELLDMIDERIGKRVEEGFAFPEELQMIREAREFRNGVYRRGEGRREDNQRGDIQQAANPNANANRNLNNQQFQQFREYLHARGLEPDHRRPGVRNAGAQDRNARGRDDGNLDIQLFQQFREFMRARAGARARREPDGGQDRNAGGQLDRRGGNNGRRQQRRQRQQEERDGMLARR